MPQLERSKFEHLLMGALMDTCWWAEGQNLFHMSCFPLTLLLPLPPFLFFNFISINFPRLAILLALAYSFLIVDPIFSLTLPTYPTSPSFSHLLSFRGKLLILFRIMYPSKMILTQIDVIRISWQFYYKSVSLAVQRNSSSFAMVIDIRRTSIPAKRPRELRRFLFCSLSFSHTYAVSAPLTARLSGDFPISRCARL